MSEDQATSQVEEENEATAEDTTEASGSNIDDLKTALKEITRLRRENAKRRVESREEKELLEDAKRWREHLDKQKTEMERLNEEKAQLQTELAAQRMAVMQRDLASEFKLDPELAEFITGSDENEMRAKAEKLAAKSVKPGPIDLHAGQRGNPVTKEGRSSGAKFLDMLAKDF